MLHSLCRGLRNQRDRYDADLSKRLFNRARIVSDHKTIVFCDQHDVVRIDVQSATLSSNDTCFLLQSKKLQQHFAAEMLLKQHHV
jgi:hypothetical protein